MSKSKETKGDQNLEKIEETLSSAEAFIQKHRKNLVYIGFALLLLTGGYFGYKTWYLAPLEDEAEAQLFLAVQAFEQDSLRQALEGDGSFTGLVDIASQYGATKAGNLAHYYAGIAYLHMGEYDNAIASLKKFSGNSMIGKAMAIGNIGDAYSEMGDYNQAVTYYKKAAKHKPNMMATPRFLIKAGTLLDQEGRYEEAIKLYKQLQQDFPTATEAREIEKRILRSQTLQQQQ